MTDVGGNSRRSQGAVNRISSIPGKTPSGSPPKFRGGGSGMTRGMKPKPAPPKVNNYILLRN